MTQIPKTIIRSAVVVFDPLAAELAKIPQERQGQVLRDAAIFVAGMEAQARAVQNVRAGT